MKVKYEITMYNWYGDVCYYAYIPDIGWGRYFDVYADAISWCKRACECYYGKEAV